MAHEGHGHKDSVRAPHGGIIKPLGNGFVELVTGRNQIKIYVLNGALQKAASPDLTATLQTPKGSKEPLVLTAAGDALQGNLPAKGAHRYTLEITCKQGGTPQTVSFTVEPEA